MNPLIYYIGTTLIYGVCLVGGLFVTDLGLVFDLISAFTLSFLCFMWPGLFYIVAESRYGDKMTRDSRKIHRIHAYFQIVLGVINVIIPLTSTIIK